MPWTKSGELDICDDHGKRFTVRNASIRAGACRLGVILPNTSKEALRSFSPGFSPLGYRPGRKSQKPQPGKGKGGSGPKPSPVLAHLSSFDQ